MYESFNIPSFYLSGDVWVQHLKFFSILHVSVIDRENIPRVDLDVIDTW